MPKDKEREIKDLNLEDLEKVGIRKDKAFDIENFLYEKRNPIIKILLGLILIGLGVIVYKAGLYKDTKIEVVENQDHQTDETSEIIVEIAGAVEKPGVYKLKNGSRVEDLLIVAGGLSANADRDWFEKVINRASRLSDGQKIYIPRINEQTEGLSAKKSEGGRVEPVGLNQVQDALVNINSASPKELEELPGIGPVYAQRIIEHRPYSTKEELLSKEVLNKSVYEKIKDRIVVY